MKRSPLVVGILVAIMVSGCGKLSDSQKQAASDIASGLAGGTGKNLANGADTLIGRAPSQATSRIGQMLEGAMWLTRFKVIEHPLVERWSRGADLTIPTTVCADGNNTYCTSSCPTTSSFKVACSFGSTAADYTCNGTTYEFTNGTFSITADFASTGGSYGSGTGNFALNVTIGGAVTGGALEGGKTFECGMNFTIDIQGLKNGTVTHFSPSCDNYTCKYDGKDLPCEDVQSKMATSTISCT